MSCLVQCRKELGRVADLLRDGEIRQAPCLAQDATISEIRAIFAGENSASGRLYVVDGQGVFLGVVCLEDILRYSLFYNHDPYSHVSSRAQLSQAETAAGFMRKRIVARPGDDLVDALEKMVAEKQREIAVVDDRGRITALLTLKDLLCYDLHHCLGPLDREEY